MAKNRKPTKNENRKKRRKAPHPTRFAREATRGEDYRSQRGPTPVLQLTPRRTPTLERFAGLAAEHFGPLGAIVELVGAKLTIDGDEVSVTGDASDTLDSVGLNRYGREMERVTKLEILDHVAGTESRFTPYGLEILQNGKHVALVKVSHTAVRHGLSPVVVGNFLVGDGLHWDTLRQELGGPSLVAVIHELPGSASPDDKARAELASQRIRNERSSGWELNIAIRGDESDDVVTFRPLSQRATSLEVPFQFDSAAGDIVRGALRLGKPEGILDIVTARRPSDQVLTRAWVFTLGAFADLTCSGHRDHKSRGAGGTGSHGTPRGNGPTSDIGEDGEIRIIPRTRSTVSPRGPELSDRLTPSAHTARLLDGGYYVAGHKTRLAPGKRATPEARQRAAALGIRLEPGETWTREHWRGIVGDKPTLEFLWREANDATLAARAA